MFSCYNISLSCCLYTFYGCLNTYFGIYQTNYIKGMDQMQELPEYEDLTTAKVSPSLAFRHLQEKLSNKRIKSGREKFNTPYEGMIED